MSLPPASPPRPGPPAQPIDRWTDRAYELVISEHILEGLSRTWRKPYYQQRYSGTLLQRGSKDGWQAAGGHGRSPWRRPGLPGGRPGGDQGGRTGADEGIRASSLTHQPCGQQSTDSLERVQQTLSLLRSEATLVVPVTTVRGVAADAEDDLVLATAIAGDAGFFVTGDRYLQALGRYENVVILSPASSSRSSRSSKPRPCHEGARDRAGSLLER